MKFIKFCLFVFVLIFLTYSDIAAAEVEKPKIGLLVQPPRENRSLGKTSFDYKPQVGRLVGVKYLRMSISNKRVSRKDLENYKEAVDEGFGIILHIVNRDAGEKTSSYPEDLGEYKRQLSDLLDNLSGKYKPEFIAIENEELAKNFYDGSIEEYITQLKAAIEVAHSKGVKVTDGGITTLHVMTYLDYLNRGMKKEAEDFKERGIPKNLLRNMDSRAFGARGQKLTDATYKLIEALKNSNIDYVNFHWYVEDPKALQEAVTYLRRATGKAVITTEIGQHDDSVEWVKNVLPKAYELDLPYIIWFSGDGKKAFALQEPDGNSLRPSGEYFKEFVKSIDSEN